MLLCIMTSLSIKHTLVRASPPAIGSTSVLSIATILLEVSEKGNKISGTPTPPRFIHREWHVSVGVKQYPSRDQMRVNIGEEKPTMTIQVRYAIWMVSYPMSYKYI